LEFLPVFKKRPAVPSRPVVPEGVDPYTRRPFGTPPSQYRPEPLRPTGTSPVTGAFGPGQRLRDMLGDNAPETPSRGRTSIGSGWGGIE
jgi:hypothetical protein